MCSKGARRARLDDPGTRADRSDGGPHHPPAAAAAAIFDRAVQLLEDVLGSDAKTSRAAHLLGLVLWAWVVTVLGAMTTVALLATSAPWWALVISVLGVTAAGRGVRL